MEKQIEELLRLLNQGIKHLPESVGIIVQQYALRKYIDAGFEFVIAAILITVAIVFIVKWYKKPVIASGAFEGERPDEWMAIVSLTTGITGFMFLMFSAGDLARAVSPIYSLINSLK
jgi:hypothetical protein